MLVCIYFQVLNRIDKHIAAYAVHAAVCLNKGSLSCFKDIYLVYNILKFPAEAKG